MSNNNDNLLSKFPTYQRVSKWMGERLADYFRTVYIKHEWFGLDIRFDIRFKSDEPGQWETGEWLVRDGGRIGLIK